MRSIRSLLSRQNKLNRKLRKAVVQGKLRQVADLLEAGASPTWMEHGVDSSDELNALLLACSYGNVEVLDLLLDSFFETPQMLSLWGRHMYCVVIRSGHWKAFHRIFTRKVALNPVGSARSKLPAPAFIAAECGQSRMLQFLVKAQARELAGYSFNGHSLLSIASKNGHYDCVEVLLSQLVLTDEMMDFALEVARVNNQAHVLVLLTSCLPEYMSSPVPSGVRRPSVTFTVDKNSFISELSGGDGHKLRRSSQSHNRGSLAETDILSEYGDEEGLTRTSSAEQLQRRSSAAWLYHSDNDLQVYHPYMEGDADELGYDASEAQRYEAYIQGLDNESEQGWTSTPPVHYASTGARSRRTLSIESEEKAEETLARIAERREALKQEQRKAAKKKSKKNWFYHNEVILPYEDASDDSTATTTTSTPQQPQDSVLELQQPPLSAKPPLSGKPPLPPKSNASSKGFHIPAMITQVSRKLISVRSKTVQREKPSM